MLIDKIIIEVDKALKTLLTKPHSQRDHPDAMITEDNLTYDEIKQTINLMRVNHCGEICAQALYQGQALFARDKTQQKTLNTAANEETEHLAWTYQRIKELGGRTSVFNPLFYFGSFVLGVIAGGIGDKWSLGFLEETENQVEVHLQEYQKKLPQNDVKSLAILQQMQIDEAKHAQMAHDFGAAQLPRVIKSAMHAMSSVMKTVTYYC